MFKFKLEGNVMHDDDDYCNNRYDVCVSVLICYDLIMSCDAGVSNQPFLPSQRF